MLVAVQTTQARFSAASAEMGKALAHLLNALGAIAVMVASGSVVVGVVVTTAVVLIARVAVSPRRRKIP
jgi:hypothetical protein